MSGFIRKAVSFNLDNAHQRELYEWVMKQSGKNFSGFVKTVLYAHKNRQGSTGSGVVEIPEDTSGGGSDSISSVMSDFL